MHKLKFVAALIAIFASATVFAKIAGTYVVEFEGMPTRGGETTLTFAVDDEGNYSATLSSAMGDMEGDSVEVDGNEFAFSVTREGPQGDFTMSYSGKVEDGEMSGTLTHNWGEASFTGKLKEEESEEEGEGGEESGEGEAEA